MQNRELSAFTPLRWNLPQPAKKETGIVVRVLYTYGPISGYTSVFFLTADMLNQDKLKIEFLLLFKSYVLLLPCWISHEQLYAALFRTVKPGATKSRPIPAASRKQLSCDGS